MSDNSISIVPRQSSFADKIAKEEEILKWLMSQDIIKGTLSDCVLNSAKGYAISDGARKIVINSDKLPFGLITNGLEITTERQSFHTGEYGLDECICPSCEANIVFEEWSFLNHWYEMNIDNITCPLCDVENKIHQLTFVPEWGFSDLGFTFWNWADLSSEFIEEFSQRLGQEVSVVYMKM